MTSSRYNYDGNCTGLLCDNVRLIVQITGIIHRQYDEKYAEEIYEKAGVPFTDAARKFWSEWSGVTDRVSHLTVKTLRFYEKEGLLKPASVDECYIDGIWNKESEDEWLTEI